MLRSIRSIGSLFDIDMLQEEKALGSELILVRKGNQIHILLLYLVAIYGIAYGLVNIFQGFYLQSMINFSAVLLTVFAYYLAIWGWMLTSKIFNLTQMIVVISAMFYFSPGAASHEGDSVIVFFIPIIIGTLIVFQGPERRFGYLLGILILMVILLLMVLDMHYEGEKRTQYAEGVSIELILNMVGSAIATFLEVAMILRLSNKIDERLIKTNHELDNFVYSVSHDLRSPLMSVRGLIMLIKERPIGDKVAMDYLEMANRSINSLDDTIREILDYSRNSRLETQSESFDVVPLLHQIFSDLQYVSEEVFSFHVEPSDNTLVHTDKSRLNTVLRNVIGNAVKYRKTDIDNPFVRVRFERDIKGIAFIIEDNGEGIPADKIDRVYDMFYRGSNTGQGTGLGLYICREIMDKLGGQISLTSVWGEGTTVRIFIPQQTTSTASTPHLT